MRRGIAISLVLAGRAMLGPAFAAPNMVSFKKDIAPVLRDNCAACHVTGDEPGGLKLYPSAAYRSIVKVHSNESPLLLVNPGDPKASYLLHKIEGTQLDVGGAGTRMPPGTSGLPKETVDALRQWIAQGAKNN